MSLSAQVSTLEPRRVDEVGAGLVARDFELDSALHSLRFSGGVVIIGEAGIGKTALAAAVAERLSTPPVAWVVATAASRSIPLGALSNLLPADLATIHPALVAQHVDSRLRELARTDRRATTSPVVVLDDAQLLDAQSAAVLLSLMSAKSLRLLATMRTGGSPSDAITALWKERLVDRLDLMPLNHRATRQLLESLLDGPVSSGTVEVLWNSTRGNPFYLTELARFGPGHGQLELKSGVWWWTGGTEMPPRLGELLQRRIDAVSPAGREAIELLALGEPLPYETMSSVVSEDAILELDEHKIVTSDERDGGVLLLRFAHPLLQAVAERQLSPTRRRALAGRLRDAPAEHVDVVRRAAWEDAGGGTPNVDLLLSAADAVMLNDAESAVRLATRARRAGGGLRAATMLAAAQSELGRPDLARQTLDSVADEPQSPEEWFAYLSEDFSLALWGERDPDGARQVLHRQHELLPDSFRNDTTGFEALLSLFTAGCLDVLPLAQTVLDNQPSTSAKIRALTCLTGALAFADRGPEAIAAGQQLLDALATTRVSATRAGVAHALIAATGLFYGAAYRLPRSVGPMGRWPGPPDRLGVGPDSPVLIGAGADSRSPAHSGDDVADIGWPLLVGLRRHLHGDLEGAVAPLREAFVQQQSGQGLFQSETSAELIVVLSELGHVDEASAILRDHPPDRVAIIPGLLPWATSAVEAAEGHHGRATDSAIEAARTAAGQGSAGMAMNFLIDASRYGDPRRAAQALPDLGLPLDTDVQRVRAADIMARAGRSAAMMLGAAEIQLVAGFSRHAQELAELAGTVDTSRQHGRAIAAVLRQARQRLGGHRASAAALSASPLTQRETEVARLASRGLSDREIADELVLSIRTVQSHLASSYRKLGIGSRSELAELSA